MRLRPTTPPARLISLVSMIDVLMIMLVFFMVTSTYLDLDMIPVAEPAPDASGTDPGEAVAPLVIRLGGDGTAYVRGQPQRPADLTALIAASDTGRAVTILPSLRADTQSLVSLMDTLTLAGVDRLRILRVGTP